MARWWWSGCSDAAGAVVAPVVDGLVGGARDPEVCGVDGAVMSPPFRSLKAVEECPPLLAVVVRGDVGDVLPEGEFEPSLVDATGGDFQ